MFPEIFVDRRNYLFESLYISLDLDKKVLITDGSAAVLHPKYIFNKEPYIIFTYRLMSKVKNNLKKRYYEDLYVAYADNTKLYVPENLDEFKNVIFEIERRKYQNNLNEYPDS